MSMDFKPGDVVYVEFTTQVFSTGSATNADSLPTGTVNKNGTDDGAVTVTVTNIDTGRYKASFTIPTTYIPGDVLNLTIAATVSSVAGKAAIWHAKLGYGFVSSGTAAAGGASTITLQTALGADSRGVGCILAIVAGTGSGQAGVIASYVNSTKVATMGRAWVTNPDNTSVYVILYCDIPKVDSSLRVDLGSILGTASAGAVGKVALDMAQALPPAPAANTVGEALFASDIQLGRIGTCQAGSTSTTIKLDSGASSTTDRYVGYEVYLYGGTGGGVRGVGQQRTIIAYNGTTKVATVDSAWGTTPDVTTTFMLEPHPICNVTMWLGAAVTLSNTNYPNVTAHRFTDDNGEDSGWPTNFTSLIINATTGAARADLWAILGTALTETAGQIAAGFKKLFNVATPTATVDATDPTLVASLAVKVKTDFLPSVTSGAAGGLFIAGVNAATTVTTAFTTTFTGNLTGSVGSVTGLTASNLDAAVSSRMATYTQPTGFLAATFPSTVSSLTQTQVTGGAYSIQSSSCVLGDARIGTTNTKVGFLPSVTSGASGGLFIAGNNASTTIAGNFFISANMTVGTNLTVVGDVTASSWNGDASNLTGLNAATISDGAITDSTIILPPQAAGIPTGVLGYVRRIGEIIGQFVPVKRNRTTGVVDVRKADDSGSLQSGTQSTAVVGGQTIDTRGKAT